MSVPHLVHVHWSRAGMMGVLTRSRVSSSGQDSILEPLCFPELPAAAGSGSGSGSGARSEPPLVCLFCSESAPLPQRDALLKHLLLEHKMVVADVKLIADLPK